MSLFDGSTPDSSEAQHPNGSEAIHPSAHFFGNDSVNHGFDPNPHFAAGNEHTHSYQDIMQQNDPLKLVHTMHMEPLELGKTFVHPHGVHDYVRQDGTPVHGYWRDGDGDTSFDRNVSQGGGYFRDLSE